MSVGAQDERLQAERQASPAHTSGQWEEDPEERYQAQGPLGGRCGATASLHKGPRGLRRTGER
jgi:hypothetical protein